MGKTKGKTQFISNLGRIPNSKPRATSKANCAPMKEVTPRGPGVHTCTQGELTAAYFPSGLRRWCSYTGQPGPHLFFFLEPNWFEQSLTKLLPHSAPGTNHQPPLYRKQLYSLIQSWRRVGARIKTCAPLTQACTLFFFFFK